MSEHTFKADKVTRAEYAEMVVAIGPDNAAVLTAIRFGYSDQTREQAARYLSPKDAE